MSRLARRAALLAAVVSLVAAPVATSATPVDSEPLREAVTTDGIFEHLEEFQAIADANDDTRASATSGYDASVDYVVSQLDPNYYDIQVQEFQFDAFRELAPAVLEQIAPTATTYDNEGEDAVVITMEYSGTGDVTGTLIATNDIVIPPGAQASTSNSGCELEDYPAPPSDEPAIALVQRGTCDFTVKAELAQQAGYEAIIIFNEGQEGREETLSGTLGADTEATIPAVGVDFPTGAALYGLLQSGAVTMRVATSGEILRDQTTYNVIASTKTGRDDRVVVAGAHLDSVYEGPGIQDNGSGSATILEIAQEMAEAGVEPVNQVRFAWWGAEESGLIGSQHYVDSLTKQEQHDIAVNLNFDMVASPNYVRFVYDGSSGSTGSGVVENVFGGYFDSMGLEYEPTAFDGRSDYDAFISVGIPAGGLFTGAEGVKTEEQEAIYGGTAGVAYDPCYHAACDDIDNINVEALDHMSDAAAHAILTFAMTKSAVQGTARGKGHYEAEFQAAHLRK
jgi:Zn-dependent M28 family amino/carboxypeptidase